MLEAVARGKAHWLFDKQKSELFARVRRPQEDMVTSAVFGTASLLPMPDRRRAFELLLGVDCIGAADFPKDEGIAATLWPAFAGTGSRRRVEPDVLLTCNDRTVIVEVKWHAPLPDHQVADEIAAVRASGRHVRALLLLGEAEDVGWSSEDDPPVFQRTWREVSAELDVRGGGDSSLDRWRRIVHAFLQKTDLGHVFGGLKRVLDPGTTTYRFQRPGMAPWFRRPIHEVGAVRYTYRGELR